MMQKANTSINPHRKIRNKDDTIWERKTSLLRGIRSPKKGF